MKRILAFAVILAFGFGCRALEDSKEDDEIKSNPPDDKPQDSNPSSEKDDSEEDENYISSDRDYSQDRRINGNRTRERRIYFNPLQRIRTIKDYEKEIEDLKNENFGLKHQLSHYKTSSSPGNIQEDIQRLLFDSKKSIDILEGENEVLNKQISNMQDVIKRMGEERDEVETRLAANTQEYASRASMLEDENNRLLKHIESVNDSNNKMRSENNVLNEHLKESKNIVEEQKSYIEEILREKENIENMLSTAMREKEEVMKSGKFQFEKEMSSYKNALLNYNKEKDQIAYERERERAENNSKIVQLQSLIASLEGRINSKEQEFARMKEYYEGKEREYETVCRQKQSNEMYLREMGENYIRETKDKQDLALRNEELTREIEQLRGTQEELKKRVEVAENERRALSYKVSQERGDIGEINAVRSEAEKLKRERDRLCQELESKKRACMQHVEDLERSRNVSDSFKNMVQRKGRECDRRLSEVERLAEEINMKIDSAKDVLLFSCNRNGISNDTKEDRMRYEQRVSSLQDEVRSLKDKIEVYKRMTVVGEDNREFLRSFNMDTSMSFNDIIGKLKSSYKEMVRKIKIMDKEVHEVTNFAENNRDAMHDRTMKILEGFTREFNVARKDLEICKRYLEKKGRENKELKADKLRLEMKFDECKRNEEKMKNLYSAMSSKLKKKDDVISRLEMRIGTRF